MLQEAELIDRLCRSTVYQDFERSFCEVTQFPLRLSPPENRSLAGNGQVMSTVLICHRCSGASWR